jgi:hypothetical protein
VLLSPLSTTKYVPALSVAVMFSVLLLLWSQSTIEYIVSPASVYFHSWSTMSQPVVPVLLMLTVRVLFRVKR